MKKDIKSQTIDNSTKKYPVESKRWKSDVYKALKLGYKVEALNEEQAEYIKKIEVFAPDKSSGKRVQKVKIYFNFVDDVEIPVISEPVVAKSTPGRRKTV